MPIALQTLDLIELLYTLYSPKVVANNEEGTKMHKNRLLTKYPEQTSHTVETTDKIAEVLVDKIFISKPLRGR